LILSFYFQVYVLIAWISWTNFNNVAIWQSRYL